MIQRLKLASVSLSAALLFAFIVDQFLGILGYPNDYLTPVTHPPNYLEIRDFVDYRYFFQTNSQGLRYPEISLTKTENECRVFLVGDSFTEGIGMEMSETLSLLLENEFADSKAKVYFINGGIAGTGPFEYGKVLARIGEKYQPDAVFIMYYANDLNSISFDMDSNFMFSENELSKSIPNATFHLIFPRTYALVQTAFATWEYDRQHFTSDFIADITGEARRRGIDENKIRTWEERVPRDLVQAVEDRRFNGHPLAYGLLYPNYLTDALDLSSDQARRKWDILEAILTEFQSFARKKDIQLALVYIPERLQYDSKQHKSENIWYQSGVKVNSEWLYVQTEIQSRLTRWCDQKNVPCIDLTPRFRKAVQETDVELTWQLDNHWNGHGNEVAAKAIAAWIRANKILDDKCLLD